MQRHWNSSPLELECYSCREYIYMAAQEPRPSLNTQTGLIATHPKQSWWPWFTVGLLVHSDETSFVHFFSTLAWTLPVQLGFSNTIIQGSLAQVLNMPIPAVHLFKRPTEKFGKWTILHIPNSSSVLTWVLLMDMGSQMEMCSQQCHNRRVPALHQWEECHGSSDPIYATSHN